jgi:predicted esterase
LLTTAAARADLIIFKDGFTLHGRLTQGTTFTVDALTGVSVRHTKPGAFFCIEDDVRSIVFCPSHVKDVSKKDVNKGLVPIAYRRPAMPGRTVAIDPAWEIESVTDWDRYGERAITLKTPKRRVKIDQRLTILTPQYLRVDALRYNWNVYYKTTEFSPDTIRNLLSPHLAKSKDSEAQKAMKVYEFFLQAGWTDLARRELQAILKDFPDQKKTVEPLLETLTKQSAAATLDEVETAHRVGQHEEAQERIRRFFADGQDALVREEQVLQLQVHKTKYAEAEEALTLARRLLKDLPPKADEEERPLFEAAARAIAGELNFDTLPRLETFLALGKQLERDLKEKRKPSQSVEEVLALAVSGWLLGNSAAEPNAATARRLWEARQFILEYQKLDAPGERRRVLNSYSATKGLDATELAQLIRNLPPPEPHPVSTKVLKLNTEAGGDYFVLLPPEYHHYRPYPVLFVLHRADEQPAALLGRFRDLAARHGYILVAPAWGNGLRATYEYTPKQHAAVTETLRDLRRRFQVDSDRVFLFGCEQGGHMAFDVGLSHPDLFAGVLPMSAAPWWFGKFYKTNAQHLPFYVVNGERNGNEPKAIREQFQFWVRCGYNVLYVEYKGRGPEWFEAELPTLFDWMDRKKRARPMRELGLLPAGGGAGEEFRTMRPTDDHFYWLSTSALYSDFQNEVVNGGWVRQVKVATLQANIFPNNLIHLNVRGVRQVSIWFAPGMIDFGKPVTVRVNMQELRNSKSQPVQPSLETLLEDFYRNGDRQRLFLAKVDVKL